MKWPRLRLSTLLVLMVPLAVLFYWTSEDRIADTLDNQARCYDNISNLGMFLLSDRELYAHFPFNSPRHSWRTRLHPPDGYDFSLPWNAARNLAAAHQDSWHFSCFSCSNNQPWPDGFTNYVAWTDHGVSSLKRADAIPRNSPQAAEFILLLEYPNSDILWTEPRDLDINDLDKLTPGADPHGLGVLFADGHFERLPLPELRDRLTRLGLPDPSPTSQPAPNAP